MIDFEKIKEIYGDDVVFLIKDNKNEVEKNIKYLKSLGIEDVENIFERYAPIFLDDYNNFVNKILELIHEIGPEYINILSEDSSYFTRFL